MRKLFCLLNEELKNGKDCVLVTVIASKGSVPRGAGACMLVTDRGRLYGTIGGGAVEFQSEKIALNILKTKNSHIEFFRLHKNQIQDLGMICGGDIHIYFRYIPESDASVLALTEKIEDVYQRDEQSWLIYEITAELDGAIGLYGKNSHLFGIDAPQEVIDHLGHKSVKMETKGRSFYCEKLIQPGKAYIFGGGHVAQALVPALSAVDFRCVVLEDREQFCRSEMFAGIEETCLIDNDCIGESVTIGEDDYIVIVTRGHKDDQKVLAQVLRTPARYIGVIGSRQKSEAVFANLQAMGFTKKDLKRVISPIGLEIKAETPQEIAVSITAQMILRRAEFG